MRVQGWLVLGATALLAGCGGEVGDEEPIEEDPTVDGDLWSAGEAEEPPEIGKADAVLAERAVPKTADTSSTAVWEVKRQWSAKVDKDYEPYFKRSDNLTWSQAYEKFVAGLVKIDGANYGKTFEITTPWGKKIPSAVLECSEQAIFLRVSFAAWFNLPFFMEAIDGSRVRVYAGHFGFRTREGRYRNFNEFKTLYKDHSATATASNWPKDTKLRTKKLSGSDDQQVYPTDGATFGTFMDEMHANKRVGHFLVLLLDFFGSVNLADPANTFHVKADKIRVGDTLLERWQRAGIGHTLVVKKLEKLNTGKFTVELASGSMPRRQAVWESPVTSREYFTNDLMGGVGTNSENIPYAKLGGGLRRWRTAVIFNNSWVNTVPGDSTGDWINSTDLAAISARPARFAEILDVPNPADRRRELVVALEANRVYQREHPASCSNREKRETLIEALIDLELEEDRWSSREEHEATYRSFEDYVFPKMKYDQSKTCCWNTTTAKMGDIVLRYNYAQQQATQQCRLPEPFFAKGGNYDVFKNYARQINRAADWRDWSEDEPCPQRVVTTDTVDTSAEMMAFCELNPDFQYP